MEYIQIKEGMFDGVKSMFQKSKNLQAIQVPPNYIKISCKLQFTLGHGKDTISASWGGSNVNVSSNNQVEVFIGFQEAYAKGTAQVWSNKAWIENINPTGQQLYDYMADVLKVPHFDYSKLFESATIWVPQQQQQLKSPQQPQRQMPRPQQPRPQPQQQKPDDEFSFDSNNMLDLYK